MNAPPLSRRAAAYLACRDACAELLLQGNNAFRRGDLAAQLRAVRHRAALRAQLDMVDGALSSADWSAIAAHRRESGWSDEPPAGVEYPAGFALAVAS